MVNAGTPSFDFIDLINSREYEYKVELWYGSYLAGSATTTVPAASSTSSEAETGLYVDTAVFDGDILTVTVADTETASGNTVSVGLNGAVYVTDKSFPYYNVGNLNPKRYTTTTASFDLSTIEELKDLKGTHQIKIILYNTNLVTRTNTVSKILHTTAER